MTAAELLAAYAAGKRDFCYADFRYASFRNVLLFGDAIFRYADFRNAIFRGVIFRNADFRNADFRSTDFRNAIFRNADFRGADFRNAIFHNADFRGADFRGTDLGSADLGGQWIIQGPIRSDGYFFLLTSLTNEGVRLKVGCRNFTLGEARAHWQATRADTQLGNETFAILDCLEALAKARGYQID